jgi:hypothetical protein
MQKNKHLHNSCRKKSISFSGRVSHTHPTQFIYSNTNLHVVSTYSTMDKKVCLPVGARSLG